VKEKCAKDVNGNVSTGKNKVCERWKEYFEGLLNVSERGIAEITARPGMKERVIEIANVHVTTDEVKKAVDRLKMGEATGMDEARSMKNGDGKKAFFGHIMTKPPQSTRRLNATSSPPRGYMENIRHPFLHVRIFQQCLSPMFTFFGGKFEK